MSPRYAGAHRISPDGKRLVVITKAEGRPIGNDLEVRSLESGEVKSVFPPHGASTRWTPDSRALTYPRVEKGIWGIWTVPIDGGQDRPLIEFNSDRIFNFAWSPAGDLAVSRGTELSDVILIRNFQDKDNR